MIKIIKTELILIILLFFIISSSFSFDLFVYNTFFDLESELDSDYLKEFFIKITNLGDSLWYFIFLFIIFFVSFFLKKKLNSIAIYMNNFSIFCISHLLAIGIVTQIIKHIVGRPRPNHTNFEDGLVFKFFSFESIYHSFPSGHSSTIFCVCLIACSVAPGLRLFFYFFAVIIALSRVAVGAHFFTDVVAGALLAIIVYKTLNYYFIKHKVGFFNNGLKIKNLSLFARVNIVFVFFGFLVTLGFDFDLFFSNWFYLISSDQITTIFGESIIFVDHKNSSFFVQSLDTLSIIVREIFLPFLICYMFVFPILGFVFPIKFVFFNYKFLFKEIIYLYFAGILSLIILVNGVFKGLWGRARPNDVIEFGGDEIFSPWFQITQSCETNCSFVSGDASVGFSLIVFYFITKKIIYIYLSVLAGLILGFVRIAAGGHFLSDVIFSQIIVTLSIFISYLIYKKTFND